MSTTNLFTPIQVGSVDLSNRILMAPLTRIRAGVTHVPNDLMVEYYSQRASAGVIITECSMMLPNTSAFVGEPGIYSTEQFEAWKRVTDAVHGKDGKIFMQIWHAGRAAHPDNNDGVQNVAPSPIPVEGELNTLKGKVSHAVPHELSISEIADIVAAYATAAKRCIEEGGFDGIEVHGANGYLIDQFLRSSANTRTDSYGGSIENRARFMVEVLTAVTEAVGADKVGIRLSPYNSYNSMRDENPEELYEYVAKRCQDLNLAFVHVMRGDFFKVQSGSILPTFRKHFNNVLIANMGYTKDEGNAAIAAGEVDAIAFGTQFIANPDLPARFKLEDTPLNTLDPSTFYTPGAAGYTDYPFLA